MDQTKISGIGNYLRSEIMYEAEINPFSYIIDLSETEINNLYKYIISIMQIVIILKNLIIVIIILKFT